MAWISTSSLVIDTHLSQGARCVRDANLPRSKMHELDDHRSRLGDDDRGYRLHQRRAHHLGRARRRVRTGPCTAAARSSGSAPARTRRKARRPRGARSGGERGGRRRRRNRWSAATKTIARTAPSGSPFGGGPRWPGAVPPVVSRARCWPAATRLGEGGAQPEGPLRLEAHLELVRFIPPPRENASETTAADRLVVLPVGVEEPHVDPLAARALAKVAALVKLWAQRVLDRVRRARLAAATILRHQHLRVRVGAHRDRTNASISPNSPESPLRIPEALSAHGTRRARRGRQRRRRRRRRRCGPGGGDGGLTPLTTNS